jgi:hypothetical protein
LDELDMVGTAEDAEGESALLEVGAAEPELEAQTTDWGKSVIPAVPQMPFCKFNGRYIATMLVIWFKNDHVSLLESSFFFLGDVGLGWCHKNDRS